MLDTAGSSRLVAARRDRPPTSCAPDRRRREHSIVPERRTDSEAEREPEDASTQRAGGCGVSDRSAAATCPRQSSSGGLRLDESQPGSRDASIGRQSSRCIRSSAGCSGSAVDAPRRAEHPPPGLGLGWRRRRAPPAEPWSATPKMCRTTTLSQRSPDRCRAGPILVPRDASGSPFDRPRSSLKRFCRAKPARLSQESLTREIAAA